MGAAPSANTFGLYITTLKENTKTFDEASEAVRIFHRAKSEGVEPSSFLYNALIGKLGKARRIDDCYPAVDYFEKAGLPFVVAVNLFDGILAHHLEDVRWALAVSESIPLITFDARNKLSVRDALLAVLHNTFRTQSEALSGAR